MIFKEAQRKRLLKSLYLYEIRYDNISGSNGPIWVVGPWYLGTRNFYFFIVFLYVVVLRIRTEALKHSIKYSLICLCKKKLQTEDIYKI